MFVYFPLLGLRGSYMRKCFRGLRGPAWLRVVKEGILMRTVALQM